MPLESTRIALPIFEFWARATVVEDAAPPPAVVPGACVDGTVVGATVVAVVAELDLLLLPHAASASAATAAIAKQRTNETRMKYPPEVRISDHYGGEVGRVR